MKHIIALTLTYTALCGGPAFSVEAAPAKKMAIASDPAMDTVLASEIRKDDKARDKYRHPKETLAFFQIKPNMVVVDYLPSGGWYTRVLGPYLNKEGRYIGVNPAVAGLPFEDKDKQRVAAIGETFPAKAAGWTGLPQSGFSAFTSDKFPADMNGKVDRVLIFREMHNLFNWNVADTEIKAIRMMLKDGGMVGITDHRANPDTPYAKADGSTGYIRQSDVINFMDINGFDLVGKSEVNANPKDTKDYPDGVWTLPPSYAKKDVDRAKYEAIGESDRMTLLFRKRP